MDESPALYAFNRGLVSPLGLARADQKRVALSAETMTNWIPRVLGSMSLRPGLKYIGATASSAKPYYLPFVFATDDIALIEFTDSTMRVWMSDALLSRSSVTTAITNGTFDSNITGWTDNSDSGASIAWDAGGYMRLTGTGTAVASGYQAVTVASAYQSTEHGLLVVIERGPVTFKIGTSVGDDSLVSETSLDTGSHSFAFTPGAATFYVQFSNSAAYKVRVDSVAIESSGTVTLASPYALADLPYIRFDQSADVVFLSCDGYQQRKIERRGTRPNAKSWSISIYHVDDGPFRNSNITPTTITSSVLTGDVTLTASKPLFKSTHVGGIFAMTNQVSGVSAAIAAADSFTSGLKVTGSGSARSITLTLTGTWVATVNLQSSTDNATWANVPGFVWNGNVTGPYLDGLDGQTMYYRIGVGAGNYTSGTVQATLTFTSGTLTGIVEVTAFTSSTSVSARVLSDLGSTSATAIWKEGSWSTYRGWPTAVRLHEGRLWWFGQNGIFGSISDSFYSHDPNVEGDSGAINRTIGSGPVDTINWGVSLQRLIVGAQGAEFSVKSSALDSPLTPTDFSIKPASTQGSGGVDVTKIDQRGVYVDRSGVKVFEVAFDIQSYEYSSTDLTAIVPELGLPSIVRIGVQRKPDTRVHCVRSDGTVMICVIDKVEDVTAWIEVESTGASGLVEDVVVLPAASGSTEDQVYYAVKRTINGSTVRYLEKWAKETECRGTYSDNTSLNLQADSYVTGTNSPASTTISGLSHLEGAAVIVWADGVDYSPGTTSQTTFTVTSGAITLGTAVSNYVVGLPYTAQWKSSKLGVQASAIQTILTEHKHISHLGVIGAWLHAKGIQFGPDFSNLDDMPSMEGSTEVSTNTIRQTYDNEPIPFPGVWDSDARVCIEARAPRPATLLALVPNMEMYG